MKKDGPRSTLAEDLDQTRWDYSPVKDRTALLTPVGSLFSGVPWEFRPQYLGPAPVEVETERDEESTDDVDTQPMEPLEP